MGTRGRKSGASLAIVADGIETRPAPPEGYGELETEIWLRIVNDLPADWFKPGDIPLLKAYVDACGQYEAVTGQVGRAIADGDFTISTAQSEVLNPIFKLQDMLGKQMAMLATKLRLAQSSRYNAKRASTKFDKGAGAKLWSTG